MRLALVAALTMGCSKPVPIKAPFGVMPEVAPLDDTVILLPFVDARDAASIGRSQGYTVELPDYTSTSANTIGDTTYVTTTTHDGGTASITTSYTFDEAAIGELRRETVRVIGADSGVGDRVLDGVDTMVRGLDEAYVRAACTANGVQKAVVVEIRDFDIWSDAQSDWMGWAYLLGGTLFVASPFIPLERWNARVDLTADVYLYEVGKGYTKRQRITEQYAARGSGLPGWNRVVRGAIPWAYTHASVDLATAAVTVSR